MLQLGGHVEKRDGGRGLHNVRHVAQLEGSVESRPRRTLRRQPQHRIPETTARVRNL